MASRTTSIASAGRASLKRASPRSLSAVATMTWLSPKREPENLEGLAVRLRGSLVVTEPALRLSSPFSASPIDCRVDVGDLPRQLHRLLVERTQPYRFRFR